MGSKTGPAEALKCSRQGGKNAGKNVHGREKPGHDEIN
jgi:hypothetical protein